MKMVFQMISKRTMMMTMMMTMMTMIITNAIVIQRFSILIMIAMASQTLLTVPIVHLVWKHTSFKSISIMIITSYPTFGMSITVILGSRTLMMTITMEFQTS